MVVVDLGEPGPQLEAKSCPLEPARRVPELIFDFAADAKDVNTAPRSAHMEGDVSIQQKTESGQRDIEHLEAEAFYTVLSQKFAALEHFICREVHLLHGGQASKQGAAAPRARERSVSGGGTPRGAHGPLAYRSAIIGVQPEPEADTSFRMPSPRRCSHRSNTGNTSLATPPRHSEHHGRMFEWAAEHLHTFGQHHPRFNHVSFLPRVSVDRRSVQETSDSENSTNPRTVKTMQEVVSRMSSHHCLTIESGFGAFSRRLAQDRGLQQLMFDAFMGFFIVLNSISIGVSADVHPFWIGWDIVDVAFAAIFLMELVVKIVIFGWRDYVFGEDKLWNVFETLMAILGVFQAIVIIFADNNTNTGLGLFRIVRLARITRLIRVCRLTIFAQLMVMIRGAVGGLKTLFWATLLVCSPLYAVAIFYREMLGPHVHEGNGAELFATVPKSFFTLFRCIVSNECADLQGRPVFAVLVDNYGWGYGVLYCIVDMLMTFGLFNVIVAIFIEHVLARTKTNDQTLKRERLRDKQFFADKMAELCEIIVELKEAKKSVFPGPKALVMSAQNIELTPENLEELRADPRVVEIFHDLAISDEDTLNLFETLDADGSGTIDLAELFEGIAKLRGEARRSDVVAVNFLVQKVQTDLQVTNKRLDKLLQGLGFESRPGTMTLTKSVAAAAVAAADRSGPSPRGQEAQRSPTKTSSQSGASDSERPSTPRRGGQAI